MNEIRFDLEDILEANLGDDILASINYMSKKVSIAKIIFWHNGTNEKPVEKFKAKAEKKVSVPLKFTDRSPRREYVWFDVISSDKSKGSKNRYFYLYPATKKNEMINGIYNFFNVAMFVENSNQARRKYYKPKEDK